MDPLRGDDRFPHLDAGTRAIADALGDRFAPGITTWVEFLKQFSTRA